ncbi:MAG: hypothetical protein R3212_02710 [Xanthomonadales bacterium]|nr:hypothetical protein [Xanthomonadales bacterium]
MSFATFIEQLANPATPGAGRVRLFAKNDKMFSIDDQGVVTQLAGGVTRVTVADINDPSTALNPLSGVADGDLAIAIEANIGAADVFTVYSWDSAPGAGAENVPFTVDGASGGRWVAVGGRFQNQVLESAAQGNRLRFHFPTFAELPDPNTFHGMFAHVHDVSDPLQGESAYFAHSAAWHRLKDHRQDVQSALTPAASVDVSFGKQSNRFRTLAMDQNTTLTFSNPIAGEERVIEVTGNFTLTFPGSAKVYGGHAPNDTNNVLIRCIDATTPKYDVFVRQLTSGPAGRMIGSAGAEQATDATTTSTTFVNLLTLAFNKQLASSALIVQISAGISNNGNNQGVDIRLEIDGTVYRGCGTQRGSGDPAGAAIIQRISGLAAGTRNVRVQWRATASTAQCRPVTVPGREHCSLVVQEVTG